MGGLETARKAKVLQNIVANVKNKLNLEAYALSEVAIKAEAAGDAEAKASAAMPVGSPEKQQDSNGASFGRGSLCFLI